MSENAAETKSLKQMREGWVKGVFNDTHYVDFTGCDWNDEQMAADLQARDKMLADDGYARGYRAAVTAAADRLPPQCFRCGLSFQRKESRD